MDEKERIRAVSWLMSLEVKDLKAIMQMLKDKGVEPWKNLQ